MVFPNDIQLEANEEAPKVVFQRQSKIFNLQGRSLPENPHEFYQPLIDWMSAYIDTKPEELTVEVFLEYFNSSSGRYLLELFQVLERAGNANYRLRWIAFEDDELMIEKGEEYAKLLQLPLEIVYEND